VNAQTIVKSYFMNENAAVVELSNEQWKFIKLPSEIFILKLNSSTIENVNGNDINVRVFEKAELRFDNDFAKFQYLDNGYILMNCDISTIPNEIITLLK